MEAVAAGIAGKSRGHRVVDCFSLVGEVLMSLPFILFFVFALIAIGGAVLLIVAREPIHSALSLILVMMSLAGLYLMLGAGFIASVQIIVYAVVIMLLNAGVEERTDFSKMAKYAGIPLGILLLLELAHWMHHSLIGQTPANAAGSGNVMVATG